MQRKPKKGDRLIYTGPYAPEVACGYPPGTVVGFRNYGQKVIVLLDKSEGEVEDLYADWPVDEVKEAP